MSSSGHILQLDAFDDEYRGATIAVESSTQVDSGATAVILVGELRLVGKLQVLPVALKVFPAVSSSTKDQLLKRELFAARKIRHPRILPFLGISRYNLHTVLVSRYFPNGNLREYLKRNPDADRHSLILEVSEAVDFLHREAGLVHGDLKCDNVLVSEEDTAVLADFGLSTVAEKAKDDATTVTAIRQQSTLRFCAPELLLDDGVLQGGRRRSKTKETDVYAFGMLILEAFTGRPPWDTLSHHGVMLAICSGRTPQRPDDAHSLGAAFSDFFWDLCCACWKRDPDARPTMYRIVIDLTAQRMRAQPGILPPQNTTSLRRHASLHKTEANSLHLPPLATTATQAYTVHRDSEYPEYDSSASDDDLAIWLHPPSQTAPATPSPAPRSPPRSVVSSEEDSILVKSSSDQRPQPGHIDVDDPAPVSPFPSPTQLSLEQLPARAHARSRPNRSITPESSTWNKFPPAEEVYRLLEAFFPEHDLDKDAAEQSVSAAAAQTSQLEGSYSGRKTIQHAAKEANRNLDGKSKTESPWTAMLRKRRRELLRMKIEEFPNSARAKLSGEGGMERDRERVEDR